MTGLLVHTPVVLMSRSPGIDPTRIEEADSRDRWLAKREGCTTPQLHQLRRPTAQSSPKGMAFKPLSDAGARSRTGRTRSDPGFAEAADAPQARLRKAIGNQAGLASE